MNKFPNNYIFTDIYISKREDQNLLVSHFLKEISNLEVSLVYWAS